MKLKFANSLLIAGLIVGCAGCFTSCKDTDEDMFDNLEKKIGTAQTLAEANEARIAALESAVNDLKSADQALSDRIDALKSELEAKINAIKECTCDPTEVANLAQEVATLSSQIATLEAAQTALEGRVTTIEATLDNLPENLKERLEKLETDYAELAGTVQTVNETLGNLEVTVNGIIDETIPQINLMLENLMERLDDPDKGIEAIWSAIEEANINIETLQDMLSAYDILITELQRNYENQQITIEDLQSRMEYIEDYAAGLDVAIQDAKLLLEQEIDDLRADLQEQIDQALDYCANLDVAIVSLGNRVSLNEQAIQAIQDKISEIVADMNKLERQIGSIMIQEVYNPFIGCISAPVGVQTNILFNWFGHNDNTVEVEFPVFAYAANNYNYNPGVQFVSDEVIALLGVDKTYVGADADFLPNDGSFGRVYFSVNPTNINLYDGYELSLVNSQGEASKLTLGAPRSSSEVLTWGLSRASSTTLWEADANLAISDIGALRLRSEDNLKATVKDALKNRTLKSLAEIGIVAYKTITNNSSLPMLGLMIDDTKDGNSAISQLSIGAGCVRPLSYSTLAGADYSGKLPAWPNLDSWVTRIQNRVNGYFDEYSSKLHFEFSTIEIGEFNVDKIEIDVTLDPDAPEGVIGQFTDPLTGAIVYVYGEDLIKVLEEIKNQLADYSESVGADINDMLADLQVQINDMVDSMSSEVNGTIADVLNDLQQTINNGIEKVANRISGYWDKMETIYNHIYNVFADPNHYMQAYLFYHNPTTGNIGRFSNTKAAPTIFTGNGDCVTLIVTTLNGELLTPAYKKYVAVTNCWDADGNFSADALKKANSSTRMNEVISGDYQTAAFNYQSGYTYEILYQALDFHGNTSTQKYYVTVK